MTSKFEDLLAEAEAVDVSGWDFSWLDGRATEERPSWGYSGILRERWARAFAALDLETGGGEVLSTLTAIPPCAAATESWPPNVRRATTALHPKGIVVVATSGQPPFPFGDQAFDLVTSRHPVTVWWQEIARILAAGGSYVAQHVGPASAFEVIEYFLGPQPRERLARRPDDDVAAAAAAGLEVVDLRSERLRMEFYDVGAMVYFLRKVIWMVPGFTVDAYRPRLAELHERIAREGPFVAHSTRFLIEARKPG